MHKNSQLIFSKYAVPHFRPEMRVLEIGPAFYDQDKGVYQKLTGGKYSQWDTTDILDDPRLTYPSCGEYSFPIPDNTYDLALSGQVFEHVRKIWKWMPEVARVVKPGGLVITINPVSWPYHEAPHDCWRAFPEGMKALYEDSGMEVLDSRFECLEVNGLANKIPGRSWRYQPKFWRVRSAVFRWLGFPVECAYDTITVGRKL